MEPNSTTSDPELTRLIESGRQIAMQGRIAFVQTWSDEDHCDVCKCWRLVEARLGAGPHLPGCKGCFRPPERMLYLFAPAFPAVLQLRFSACEVHWPTLLRYIKDPTADLPSETLTYFPEEPKPTTLREYAAVLGRQAVRESVARTLARRHNSDLL